MTLRGWEDVRAAVLRRIRDGVWAPGDQIPNETDLAQEFGCARATVNRALQSLAESGLLERKRRAGTRVAALPAHHAMLRIPVVREEVEAMGKAYAYRLVLREAAEPMAPFGAAPLLRVVALHLADGAPWMAEERWISLGAIPAAADQPFDRIGANEWLVANAPLSTGQISFLAGPAEGPQAELLGCPAGTCLMQAERTTWHEARAITLVRQAFHPGFRLTIRL